MPLKIVDEHSYAYEFIQTPDLQRLCPSSLPEFFSLKYPTRADLGPGFASYVESLLPPHRHRKATSQLVMCSTLYVKNASQCVRSCLTLPIVG